jgi:hypothetical protein
MRWASTAPGYVWHKLAQLWQREGPGEALAKDLFAGTLEERIGVVANLGMTGPAAERVAAGMDEGMGQAVLSLLRSAAQPVMAHAGRGLARARRRPGLALIALRDAGNGSGTPEQHRQAARQAGAAIAELEVGHWWPVTDPRPAAQALTEFWSALTTQGSELADATTEPTEEHPR